MNNQNFPYNMSQQQQQPPQPHHIPIPTSSGQLLDGNDSSSNRRTMPFQAPQPQPYYYGPQQYMQANQNFVPGYYSPYHSYGYPYQQPHPYTSQWGEHQDQNHYQNVTIAHTAAANNQPRDLGSRNSTSHEKQTVLRDPESCERGDGESRENVGKELPQGQDASGPDRKLQETEASEVSEVVPIPGTSITLQSEEDIKKWREERRKMWLLKISNQKEKHRTDMGIAEDDVAKGGAFQDGKREKQFIQSIQTQVNRFNPKPNLNLKILQRSMASENTKLLSFIKELGDAELLEYQLTEQEKEKLFGGNARNNKSFGDNFNKRKGLASSSESRYQRGPKRPKPSNDN